MDVIERLTKQGKDLGYEGETLQTFVKEQQIELRNERKAMHEAERERREAERESCVAVNAKREAEAKIERKMRDAEAKFEREKREAEAKLEREKLELMETLRRKSAMLRNKHMKRRPLSVKLKSFLSVKN